jgi:hypothetical protein
MLQSEPLESIARTDQRMRNPHVRQVARAGRRCITDRKYTTAGNRDKSSCAASHKSLMSIKPCYGYLRHSVASRASRSLHTFDLVIARALQAMLERQVMTPVIDRLAMIWVGWKKWIPTFRKIGKWRRIPNPSDCQCGAKEFREEAVALAMTEGVGASEAGVFAVTVGFARGTRQRSPDFPQSCESPARDVLSLSLACARWDNEQPS